MSLFKSPKKNFQKNINMFFSIFLVKNEKNTIFFFDFRKLVSIFEYLLQWNCYHIICLWHEAKKNENWSKIVGGERFWKIAQKLTKKKQKKNDYNSKTMKIWKIFYAKRLRIWFYTFLVSFRKIVWINKNFTWNETLP